MSDFIFYGIFRKQFSTMLNLNKIFKYLATVKNLCSLINKRMGF